MVDDDDLAGIVVAVTGAIGDGSAFGSGLTHAVTTMMQTAARRAGLVAATDHKAEDEASERTPHQ